MNRKKVELSSQGMALGIFIEQNDKLLSALAVFSGLVAFSKEFQPEWLGAAIAFIFIAGLVLVAWELRGRFPEEDGLAIVSLQIRHFVGFGRHFNLLGLYLSHLLGHGSMAPYDCDFMVACLEHPARSSPNL